jgi:hypothetical protein
MLRHASLVSAGTLCAGLAAAAPIGHVLDLGRQAPEATTTITVPPGELLTIVLRNRIPRASYAVSVQRRPIDIPPLEAPTGGARSAGGPSPCDPYLDEADGLAGLQDEVVVANSVDHLEGALALGMCTSADDVKHITLALATTVWPIQGSWILKPGEELVVTVTRKLSSARSGSGSWCSPAVRGESGSRDGASRPIRTTTRSSSRIRTEPGSSSSRPRPSRTSGT